MLCCERWMKTDFRLDHVGKHNICTFCSVEYLRTQVLDQGMTRILCPCEDCDMSLSYEDIKQIGDEETFWRYLFHRVSHVDQDSINYFSTECSRRTRDSDGVSTKTVGPANSLTTIVSPSP